MPEKAHYLVQIIYVPEGDGASQGIQKIVGAQLLEQYAGAETDLIAASAIQAFIELEKARGNRA